MLFTDDLSLVKRHLLIRHDDDDAYLGALGQAAVRHFETWTGCRLLPPDTDPESCAEDEVPLYMDITHGLLMLIAHWYEHRELAGESLSEAPAATYALWQPYVLYHLGDPP